MPHALRSSVVLLLAALATSFVLAGPDAPRADAQGGTRVIVGLAGAAPAPRRAPTSAERALIAESQREVLDSLAPADFTLERRFDALPAFVGTATAAGLARLAADPRVASVTPDVALHFSLTEAATLIHATDVRAAIGLGGGGVTVAVIDSGVDTDHPDLVGGVAFQECFALGGCPGGGVHTSGPGSAEDANGHGTHVTGIITSNGVVAPPGIAPDTLVGVYRIESTTGSVFLSDIDASMNDIIANHPGVRAVNLSIGDGVNHGVSCDGLDPVLTLAITTLRASGTLTFIGSGNDKFTNGLAFPSCISEAVSVGAVYDDTLPETMSLGGCSETPVQDRPICFSNSATTLDILAPGAMITMPHLGGGTARSVGTSLSAPVATAAAALLVQLDASLTAAQIENALKTTGVPRLDPKSGITTPRIDVWKAAASLIADPDGDGLAGPVDNCPTVNNVLQLNNDRNLIDQSPPWSPSVDDKTLTRSDQFGDACDPDDDNDGVADSVETAGPPCATATGATQPLLLDTDGDRVTDGAECAMATDPADPLSKPAFPTPPNDPDNDRLSTAFESTIGSDPAKIDTDGDGVSDGVEYKGYGSRPVSADSDGDFVRDGCEIASINGDTLVNPGDQALLTAEILRVGAPPKLANMDLNKDGVINPGDQALQASFVMPGKCP